MRFSLRTLTVVMLLGGPALAGGIWLWRQYFPPDTDLKHYLNEPPPFPSNAIELIEDEQPHAGG